MSRRRRPASKADALIKIIPAGLLLLALLLSGGDIRRFPAALGTLLYVAVAVAAVALIGGIVYILVRKRLKAAPAVTDIAASAAAKPCEQLSLIDWYQFEKVIGRLLRLEGFQVEQRGGQRDDGGVDIIATAGNGETQLIQCKFWKSWDLDLKTVRELLGSRESVEFKGRDAKAVIYTLSDPTERATKFAYDNGIRIVTRADIAQRLNAHPVSAFPELATPDVKFCPRCDAPMVNRGKFWGCSTYGRTRCRSTIQIDVSDI